MHPLSVTLNEIEKTGILINKINLKELNYNSLINLICDTLNCQEALSIPLTKIVLTKTKGNPFLLINF